MPKHRSSTKRILENGVRLLRTSLEYFICVTPGFHKNSYGEIQFKGTGSRPTYAPFVTCDATMSPENVLRLFTEQWVISLPKIIILANGEFPKRDYSWLNVMNDSWLITNGSSPSLQRSYNSCTIAIMDINSVENKSALISTSNKGMFPAIYRHSKSKSLLKTLDQTHTHFVFVQEKKGKNWLDFRSNFLAYISSIPLEIDTNSTSFVTLPVVTVLVSDDVEALNVFSSDVRAGYPYAFCSSAEGTIDLIREAQTSNIELTSFHLKRVHRKSEALVVFHEREEIASTLSRIAADTNKKLRIYPSTDYPLLRLTLLEAMKSSKTYAVRSVIRLAMIWDCMDELKSLVFSKKQFEGEEDYMCIYLFVALSLDRSEFLEYLQELGVNPYAKLTVKMLWRLYYEALFNDQYMTETSFVIRKFAREFIKKDASNLLNVIGRFIGRVTKYEVTGLYTGEEYMDRSCKADSGRLTKLAGPISFEDSSSPVVPHADRDLFLWCVLFGKTNLAKLFWKNGTNYAASALIARAILRGQAELIDFNTQDSALADELHEQSHLWTQEAISFVEASFRVRKQATLCMLTHKMPEFGGCSILQLGYVTKCPEFIAQPAPQSALDYIWLGKTKKGKPKWKVFLTMLCPLLVPCLNVVDRTNHFLPSVSQVYQSTFTNDVDNEQNEDREAGLGAGVVYVMQTISKTARKTNFDLPEKQLTKAANFSEDVFDYFNSPSIKFLVHSVYLVLSMVILSLVLVIEVPPYFSLSKTNLLTFLVLFYMIGMTVDEARQILLTPDNTSGLRKLTSWLSDNWNRIDLLMVLTFFIGKGLTFSHHPPVYAIKIFFSLSLFFMTMRCFQIYLVFPILGPKIYMMGKMFRDVRVFLSIMALVFFCYGVVLESLQSEISIKNTDEKVNDTESAFILFYNSILREPYWQIYGNALGDAPEKSDSYQTFIPSLITAFYVLFANLLMVNLLIAMFSYTFQNIQDNAFLYWKFHRFEVVKEFWDRPWLPSPFILIEDIVRFLQWFHNNRPRGSQAFNRTITEEQKELLDDFEKEVQTLISEKETLDQELTNSLQRDVKKILKKLEEHDIDINEQTHRKESRNLSTNIEY